MVQESYVLSYQSTGGLTYKLYPILNQLYTRVPKNSLNIFQALQRHNLLKKHSNITYVYDNVRRKFLKQDTLIRSVLCVENVL